MFYLFFASLLQSVLQFCVLISIETFILQQKNNKFCEKMFIFKNKETKKQGSLLTHANYHKLFNNYN